MAAGDGDRGANALYDCVGGKAMFATAVNCLAHRGRLVEISATGGRDVQFDLADFYYNESRLFNVDSTKRDLVQPTRMLDALRPHFKDGTFRPAPVAATYPFDAAVEAYRHVAAGASDRIVLTPNA